MTSKVLMLALAVCAIVALVALPALGQGSAGKAKADIPRMADGKPDLSGVWDHPRVTDVTQNGGPGCSSSMHVTGCKQVGSGPLSFTPAGKQIFDHHEEATAKFDPGVYCMPWGYFRSWNTPSPAEIVQRPDKVVVLFEQGTNFHTIFTDGRPHPRDLSTFGWFGHSIGRWEGDTLVVDTVGFNGKTWIDTAEHPSSDQLHVVERIHFIDADHLSYEVTWEDPKTYTKPIKNNRVFVRMKPGSEIMEWWCMENNKDLLQGHLVDGGHPPK